MNIIKKTIFAIFLSILIYHIRCNGEKDYIFEITKLGGVKQEGKVFNINFEGYPEKK